MINTFWYFLLIPTYHLGFYIALCATVVAIGSGQSTASEVTLGLCFVYYALAIIVLGTGPKWLRKRLLRTVDRVKGDDFFATWSLDSTVLTTYIGIDGPRDRLLIVDIFGARHEMSVHDVLHWEVTQDRRHTTLQLHTRLDDLPAFSMRFGKAKAQTCMAAMRRFIG